MKEKYRFIEKQLFEKAVLLIEEIIEAAKSPLPENVIASLVVEAWNISYFPEAAREAEIKDIMV